MISIRIWVLINRTMKEETLKLCEQFHTVHHRDYRPVNAEIDDISQQLKTVKNRLESFKAFPIRHHDAIQQHKQRIKRFEKRLKELLDIKDEQKALAKQFLKRFYYRVGNYVLEHGEYVYEGTGHFSEPLKLKDEARVITGLPADDVFDDLLPENNTFKICTGCGEEKALSKFYRNCGTNTGLTIRCKQCIYGSKPSKKKVNHGK